MESEKQIWERVRADTGLTAEQALLPERLSALIAQEQAAAAACRQLAARLRGAESGALRRIRAQAQNRSRQLNALRFLYSGLRSDIRAPSVPFYSAPCDALREACLLLLALQAQYEKTAREFPAQAASLAPLQAQLRQNIRVLTDILQKSL